MENNENGFSYTYSAKEQAELKRIREKYMPSTKEEDKMARLYRLDASVTQMAQAASLIVGIIGALIFGFGMSLCMTELAQIFGWHHIAALIVGILLGVIGGCLVGLAYPVYNAVMKYMRKKHGPEILRLTNELMK